MKFEISDFKKLWKPQTGSTGEDNGQVTIVGGSKLFTGAPIFSAIAASRIVDMIFLASPNEDKEIVSKVELFSKLRSVIWISREDLDEYIDKSDAILIGPGLMRYHKHLPKDVFDDAGTETKMLTHYLLTKFKDKQWVIDGGSLQTMDKEMIPPGAILTPNKKEFEILFGKISVIDAAQKYHCVILYKDIVAIATDGETIFEISGGNPGLTKGGTGDTLAGVVVGLASKNSPLLSAAAGAWLLKKTADVLYEKVGNNYNADDLAVKIFEVWKSLE